MTRRSSLTQSTQRQTQSTSARPRLRRASGLACAAALLFGAACSSVKPQRSAGPDGDVALAAEREEASLELERALRVAQAQAAPPSCHSLCKLVGQICDLTSQICGLSDRNAGRQGLAERCASARARCDRSKQRVAGSCGCQTD